MYGETSYGKHQYGEELQDSNGTVNTPPYLMSYLLSFYENCRIMKSIQDAIANELGGVRFALDDILNQFFVQKATWGLEFWERELGLPTDPTKPFAWRREMIMAKLRGIGTITKQMLINAAAAFSGGEVDVIEYPSEYGFEIRFIGVKGIPPNMAGFIEMLEQIKPAHLTYGFKYTYTVWDNLHNLTWNQAVTKTWNELKVYEGA
jgi:hypothetical protein